MNNKTRQKKKKKIYKTTDITWSAFVMYNHISYTTIFGTICSSTMTYISGFINKQHVKLIIIKSLQNKHHEYSWNHLYMIAKFKKRKDPICSNSYITKNWSVIFNVTILTLSHVCNHAISIIFSEFFIQFENNFYQF